MKQINVGLTGLTRAGKTVFLTSAIYHLTELTGKHLEEFRFHGWKYHGTRGRMRKDAVQFAYKEKLKALFAHPPEWPEPTTDVSEYPIHLRLINADGTARECQLNFLDYPGERLIDVALLDTTYEEWSDEVHERIETAPEPMQAAWARYREHLESVIEGKKEFPKSRLRATQHIFGQFCRVARELGLPIAPVEPVLKAAPEGEVPAPFFPLKRAERRQYPELVESLKKRYDRYLASSAKPFLRRIGVCDHQIVLVDLIGILNRGIERYGSDREQMHRILNCYRTLNQGWGRFFPGFARKLINPGIRRVTFAATKVDQALPADRPHFAALLKELFAKAQTGLEFDHQTLRGFDFVAVSSYACTEETTIERNGRSEPALKARIAPAGDEQVYVPPRIPESWPATREDWSQLEFPEVLPPVHSDLPDQPLPHYGMDKILFEILIDVVGG